MASLCLLCDSEATITRIAFGNVVNCPKCRQYTLTEKLFDELPKELDWATLRVDLARAVCWIFYRNGPVTVPKISWRLYLERLTELPIPQLSLGGPMAT
jgi:hypothetical protein